MGRLSGIIEVGFLSHSEEEIMARAREALGAIPDWYRKNKERIEANRAEMEAAGRRVSRELMRLQAM